MSTCIYIYIYTHIDVVVITTIIIITIILRLSFAGGVPRMALKVLTLVSNSIQLI